jgi:Ser/Thr protein kinase RdoA (MazF antagonist)
MSLESLFHRAAQRYFPRFHIEHAWETVDRHALAILRCPAGRYVLKSPYPYSRGACYARSMRSMQATALFLRECARHGLPVVTYLPNREGQWVTALPEGRLCCLMRHVDHVEGARITPDRFLDLAPMQAALHLCADSLFLPRIRRHFLTEIDLAANLRRLSRMSTRFSRALLKHGLQQAEFLRTGWRSLPTGICHNDFGTANVLVNHTGAITLIDFDFSDRNLYASELARTIAYLCALKAPSYDTDLAADYIAAYQRTRPLSDGERRIVGAILAYYGYPMYAYTQGRWSEEQLGSVLAAFRRAGIPAGPGSIM